MASVREFNITVPRPASNGSPCAVPSTPHRILLVDDEECIIAALKRLFRREPYEVQSAASAPEALELLAAQSFHLIISDHRMPNMTGVEFLRKVRKQWPDTIRIILSGYSEVNTIIAAVNEGEIYKFISKPWNDEEIKVHVRRALELRGLEEENRRMAREITSQNDRLRELNAMLEQRAADACSGQTSTQDLLETIGVGVLTVDPSGLVVGANHLANTIVSSGRSELMGMPAKSALPDALCQLIHEANDSANGFVCRRIKIGGKDIQCRANPMMVGKLCRGVAIALWEDAP